MVFLYGITLKKSSNINVAIIGSFTQPKQQEILVSKGKILELYVQDADTGIIRLIYDQEVFGCIRSMSAFRMTTKERDYVAVGSDSGRIVILRYSTDSQSFEKIHQETYGKSGCRRAVPGEYLVVEPKGRAVMLSALEKQKFVYVLNRDSENRLTISSPLPAHKPATLTFSLVSLDVGYENPSFAALEVDYSDFDTDPKLTSPPESKLLTFYELDLGVNHVVKRWQSLVPSSSHFLIPVPGGNYGPGGVLVCYHRNVVYKNEGYEDVIGQIPPRNNRTAADRELLIISSTFYQRKKKFFFLAQNELGDLLKITLLNQDNQDNGGVTGVQIEYFDTVPVSTSINIMKSGYLFVTSEFGDHHLYHFEMIGGGQGPNSGLLPGEFSYTPSPLRHLSLVQSLPSLSPILDFEVRDLHREGTPQIYCVCGRGTSSSFRVLRQGQRVEELIKCFLEEANPREIWSVPGFEGDILNSYYLVLSILYEDIPQTMVFRVDATSLTELKESRFLTSVHTLHMGTFPASNSTDLMIAQVHANGIRLIREGTIQHWDTPTLDENNENADSTKKLQIRCACSNSRQLAIGLSGGLIVYFEVHSETNRLEEIERYQFPQEISCMSLDPVPSGSVRGRFLCVGTFDRVIRIYSTNPTNSKEENSLSFMEKVLSRQIFPSEPVSLSFMDTLSGSLMIHVGLNSGMLYSSEMDKVTGALSDTRTRFMGTLPVYLRNLELSSNFNVMFAISSRTWLMIDRRIMSDENFGVMKKKKKNLTFVPLAYKKVRACCSFQSNNNNGVVFVSSDDNNNNSEDDDEIKKKKNQINFVELNEEDQKFHEERVPLLCTPRKFLYHKQSGHYFILESDINTKVLDQNNNNNQYLEQQEEEIEGEGENIEMKENNKKNNQTQKIQDEEDEDDMDLSNDDMDTTDDDDKDQKNSLLKPTIVDLKNKEYPKILINNNNNNSTEEEEHPIIAKTKPKSSHWTSFLRILDPLSKKTKYLLQLEPDEAAISMCFSYFKKLKKTLLVIGTAKDLQFFPRKCTAGFLRTYEILNSNSNNEIKLKFHHRTLLEDLPLALYGGFEGQLLVGVKHILRLYDYGSQKLLRKCETRSLPNASLLTQIERNGKRIYVSDISQSIFFVKYKKKSNKFVCFGDNLLDRYVTRFSVLDFHTIAASDKFGNIFFSRLDREEGLKAEELRVAESQDSWMYDSNFGKSETGGDNQKMKKATEIVQFYVGEVVTSIKKCQLIQGARDVLLYTTIMGSIGVLIPFRTREEYMFFQNLEMLMRQESPPLNGNDHLKFRSFYFPVKGVIDGDLCEFFLNKLDEQKRGQVAVEMDLMPNEIDKKVEYIKNQVGGF